MTAWLRQHRQAVARAAGRLGWLNALVIGVALALPAAGYALLESVRAVAGRLRVEPQISVFLDSKRADADALAARMKRDPRIARLRFVPREQALKELAAVQGLPELVGALGRNPLPDAFVVTAADEGIEPLAADLAKLPGVAHVQADALWARRLAALARLARVGLWLLAGLLGTALIAVTFNTIRLQILTQRDEIELCRLIGATHAYIRRPFFYLGSLLGLFGGIAALAIVLSGLTVLNRDLADLAYLYGSNIRLRFPNPNEMISALLAAVALGWLGAYLSVSRHLLETDRD